MVLVSADMSIAGRDVVVGVVLGTKQTLKLADSSVKVDPSLAARNSDLVGRDTRLDEPALDSVNGLAVRGKELDDLVLAQVLAVVGRVRVSPVGVSGTASCLFTATNSHVHEEVHAILRVALLESNAGRNLGVARQGAPLGPSRAGDVTLLVDDAAAGRHSDSTGKEAVKNNEAELHDEVV